MDRKQLIDCFQDTLKTCDSSALAEATEKAKKSTKVYKENFRSEASKYDYQARLVERDFITVQEGTSFATAKKYVGQGKIGVLNFANPHNPGGGVVNGAMAQEECLCRSSNLYPCLIVPEVKQDYYTYNKKKAGYFFSDRVVYADEVTVFKTDDPVPVLMPENEWFNVSILTCAAPYIAKRKYTNKAALKELFKKRIRNIFEIALENRIQILILGAFGCGAFKNPPEIVASAFNEVIKEMYPALQHNMKSIIFAIKSTNNNDPFSACPNIAAFELEFYGISSEICKERFSGGAPVAYAYGDAIMPSGRIHKVGDEFLKYYEWKNSNKYFGKQFSILGDSISTLEGYNPNGYKVFYSNDNCVKSGVATAKDAWWGKVIDFFGGELLVNNSWSGSRVTKPKGNKQLFPSGCSDERTSALHINDIRPNVILVYLGTNDWAFGAKTGNETRILDEDNNELFHYAYDAMLKKLKVNYPESEIWCCTLCETYISKRPDFKFPHKHAGIHIEEYNEIIRDVARSNRCKLIDLYDYKMAYDSIDGSHPNQSGMNTIATMIIRTMTGQKADMFLDCEEGQHEYKIVEEYTGGTRYICSRCGKVNHKSTLFSVECPEDQNNDEYVMFDPNMTTVLYSGILRLTIESSGKTIQFQKDIVEVGRDKICDLLLDGKSTISQHQATFFYENSMWFLRDNFSTNGTWLNGERIKPGKKYQLVTNDEINFAMSERIIFYKHEQNTQLAGDSDVKALVFLEAGMDAFAKSDHEDEVSLKLILASLSDAPLYLPVEIDLEAMLGSIDPEKLKAGDILQPTKDVKMRILTLTLESGVEFVPMFTSNDEANKGPSASIIRFYPQDYLPKLVQMDKPVIINPFSENRFLLSKQLITDVLLPIVQSKTKSQIEVIEQSTDKYIGKTIGGKYEVLKLIGRGGFYATYLVRSTNINKVWAMKACDKKNRYYSQVMRENLLTESYMMRKLNHPAIPKVIDIIEDDDNIFIVRDYVEGETLETIAKIHGAQPADKVVEWGKQMCSTLSYLHSQHPPLIYRDMKPANVILQSDETVKFIDFGIMRTYKQNRNYDTCCLGTKGYAAPEQFGGGQTDARTDIFGLGMTMFRLVTGVNPTEPPYEIKPICEVNPLLPKGLEYVILKCIHPNPECRYQSCEELLKDLNNYTSLPTKSKGLFGKLFKK